MYDIIRMVKVSGLDSFRANWWQFKKQKPTTTAQIIQWSVKQQNINPSVYTYTHTQKNENCDKKVQPYSDPPVLKGKGNLKQDLSVKYSKHNFDFQETTFLEWALGAGKSTEQIIHKLIGNFS